MPDVSDFAFIAVESLASFLTAVVVGVLVIAATAILILFVLPLVLLVVELAVLLVWVVALGRSWLIEAATKGPTAEAIRREARSWRESRRLVDALAVALERGEPPRQPRSYG